MRGGLQQSIARLLRPAADLLDFFFPAACPVCQKLSETGGTAVFCADCCANLKPLPTGRCCRCALPFGAGDSSPHLCADCLRQLPPYEQVFAAGLYDGSLKQAIGRFKYEGGVDLDRCLARLLVAQLDNLLLDGETLLVPVPLHPRRLRKRGYNQALLLAKMMLPALQLRQKSANFASSGQIRLASSLLERVKDGHHQQGLSARQRALNLRGVMACTRRLKGENLILIDDVMTTGATVSACAQTLIDAGAARVQVAVVARTPRH